MVAGDEVIGLRRQQRTEHGNIGRIANGVGGEGFWYNLIDLNSQNVGEVGEVDGPPLQAVIEAGQDPRQFIENVARQHDFQRALTPGADDVPWDAGRIR